MEFCLRMFPQEIQQKKTLRICGCKKKTTNTEEEDES